MRDLINRTRTLAIVMMNLPGRRGYNGSRLEIDDVEATEVARTLIDAGDALEAFQCIGVIDSNGDIYPGQPEPGTRVFVKVEGDKK